jgi:hypothetical protein
MTEYIPTVITLTKTATGDEVFKLTNTDIWLSYADIFVYTNNAYMGDKRAQQVAIYANDIYEFPLPININDLFFKNYTAGSNTVIVVIGSILSKNKAKEHGITLPP